jgi:hypothetical protein
MKGVNNMDLENETENVKSEEQSEEQAKLLKKQIRDQETAEEKAKLTSAIKSMNITTPEQMAEFMHDYVLDATNQKFDGDALLVWTGIKKIRKTVGLLNDDKIVCEIYINDKVLYVPIEKLKSPSYFIDQYARTFDVFLNIKNTVWLNMVNALFQQKMETVAASEESEHVFIARQTWAKICKYRVSEDSAGYKANKGILKKDGGYFVTSEAITKLTEKTKIRMNDLSGAMTQLGLKYPGTKKKLELRCWELSEVALKLEGVI